MRFALLILLSVCPIALADELKMSSTENDLIDAVTKLGGTAKIDSQLEKDARVAATFEKVDDKILTALSKLPELGSLDIRSDAKATARGYSALKELPNLQRLFLSSATFTIEEATAISSIQTLNMLTATGSKMTDLDVSRLAKLKNLKYLDLMDSPVTDKGVALLLSLAKLEELNLSGTKVTDAGVKKLLTVETLKQVQLNNTKVTDAAIGAIEDQLQISKRELKILR